MTALIGTLVFCLLLSIWANGYWKRKRDEADQLAYAAWQHAAHRDEQFHCDQQQYVVVLDAARWFSNLDHRMAFSMGGQPMATLRGWEVMHNQHVEGLHALMQRLAEYFNEPDPCPCGRCVIAREVAQRKAETLTDYLGPLTGPRFGRDVGLCQRSMRELG